jgi:hypothetical protein
MTQVAAGHPSGDSAYRHLASLIGRSPDSEADVEALRSLADVDHPDARRLAEAVRTAPDLQDQPLRELLHGLELVEPTRFWESLGVRTCNVLGRSGFTVWSDFCRTSATAIGELRGAGPETIEETVRATAREWATAHLSRWGAMWADEGSRRPPAPRPGEERGPIGLDSAFVELERMPGFHAFNQRRLQPGRPRTYREIAAEFGRSRNAITADPGRVERTIRRRMKDEAWPIAVAVGRLKDRLGSLARPAELDESLAILHRDTGALPKNAPQRQRLLLHIAKYRVSEEWILGPDVETLTPAIINAIAGDESADVETIAGHLSAIGIREHLQLQWLASQPGYRIVAGELVPTDG